MILQSLLRLYDALAAQDKVIQPGWGKAKVSHRIVIDADGHLITIMPIQKKGKSGKNRAIDMDVPKPVIRTSGIKPNFLCDSAAYFLAVPNEIKSENDIAPGEDKPNQEDSEANKVNCEKAVSRFEATRKFHHQVLDGCNSVAAQAVLKYFDAWSQACAMQNPMILSEIEKSASLIFSVIDQDVLDDQEVRRAWEAHYKETEQTADKPVGVCLITGKENQNIAVLHPKIKGVAGAQSSGANLVSFNAPSFCSYGLVDKDQGRNAPVSEEAAYKYGEALNYLLKDDMHKIVIGKDPTIVYWSEHASSAYEDCISQLMGNDRKISDNDLHHVLETVKNGESASLHDIEIDPAEPFYILGLAPNSARISVRFFIQNSFGELVKNVALHQERMAIINPKAANSQWGQVPLEQILNETVNPHASHAVSSPLLSGSLLRAIMINGKYPESLYRNILMRIFADRDSKEEGKKQITKVNYIRAAVIKAYLLQNGAPHWKGDIQMAVNNECREISYVLGRLFSVLERIQTKANPEINSTIKDRYFNSCCATPAVTFPVVLKLANAHLGKLRKTNPGSAVNLQKKLEELLAMVTMPDVGRPIPARLTLEEQGAFVLGYYQECENFFSKVKENKEKAENVVEIKEEP